MNTDSVPLRILVIRLSAMGDVAMTVPVVAALRQVAPKARIMMLTPSFLQPFFREIEGLEFFAPDFKRRHKGLPGIWRLSRDLGTFDMVADLHDVIRSKMLRRIMERRGARIAYIDKGREEKKALVSLEEKVRHPLKTTVERYREVFCSLGFDLPPIEAPARLYYELNADVRALAGERTRHWIGISPFAQHRGKIYPLDQMEQVIAWLSRLPETRLFIFGGGPAERAYAERMQATYPQVVSVIGRVRLAQEMELISHLDLMVSMDSSGMHMASLVGVPVVSIWGATHPYAGFYGLGQDPKDAVQLDMWCRPCSIYGNKPCAFDEYPCMMNLRPQMVVEKVCRKLGIVCPEE